MNLSMALNIMPIPKRDEYLEIIRQVFHEDENDIVPDYDEDLFENENQQAFLDAGHFYGL